MTLPSGGRPVGRGARPYRDHATGTDLLARTAGPAARAEPTRITAAAAPEAVWDHEGGSTRRGADLTD